AYFNPATSLLQYSNQGFAHNIGTTLAVLPGQSIAADFSLSDFVNCQGSILPRTSVNLNNGIAISGTGRVNLGAGQLTVNDSLSSISAGTLTANAEYIGNLGSGSFSQSGGMNLLSSNSSNRLYVGYAVGDGGNYSMTGGSLAAPSSYIGFNGSGTF